jgi:hypothetical protein
VGDFRSAVRYWVAKRSHLKTIGQRAKRRRVTTFPSLAKTNNANTKFHGKK